MSDINTASMLERPLSSVLAFAGALPFIAGAALRMLDIETLAFNLLTTDLIATYSLLILSFMSGVHWGQHLHLAAAWRTWLPLTSNLITVLAWFSFLLFDFVTLCAVMALGYALLLGIDRRLHSERIINDVYLLMRTRVTTLVIVCLIISAIAG